MAKYEEEKKSVQKNPDAGGTKNARKKPEKKTFFSVFLSTLWTIMKIVIPAVAIVGIAFVVFVILSADNLDVEDLRLDLTSTVCYEDENGEVVEYEKITTDENRAWVPLNQVPQYMRDAFISIEDERFYSHSGFDIKRTTKAVIDYARYGSNAQGGSTITQQLIKNITNNTDRTPVRKIQEIWMAYKLERKLSKDQILELYVNTIYLAQGVNGVQTASKLYFDKDVSELSLAQCASIAGITQYPAYYDPFLHPDNNKEKQELVLKKMLELGKITQEEHDEAVAEKLVFKKGNMQTTSVKTQSYFTDYVVSDVINEFVKQKGLSKTLAERKLQSGGYKIIATIDPTVQKSIDNVFGSASNFPSSPVSPAPQGAIVVMDVKTGEVKGMAGGIGKKEGAYSLNRATATYRQPGSSIKPLSVYAPAIDTGLVMPGTIYEDKKITYGEWSPKNSYSGFKGNMTVRKAIEISCNTIAVQIVDDMGINTSYDYLKNKFKLSTVVDADKALAPLSLGGLTKGATVMDMAAAYAVFPNAGVYNTPITFTKVIDSDGNVILKNKASSSNAVKKTTASAMNDLLKGVVSSGTGTGASISGVTIAGKTGTTDDNKDRWFVGYSSDYVAAVWYGYDTPRVMNHLGYNNPAVTAFKKVMTPIVKAKSGEEKNGFLDTTAPKKNTVAVCSVSGLLPCSYCYEKNTVVSEVYTNGNEPTGTCSQQAHEKIETVDPSRADTPISSENDIPPEALTTPVTTPGEQNEPQNPTSEEEFSGQQN